MIVHKATLKETEVFKRAVVLASLSGYANKVGALAVGPAKIVAGAFNRLEDESKKAKDHKYHAESAVLMMFKPSAKIVLYVARMNADYTVLDSRPCIGCMRTIKSFRIEQIVYQDPYGHLVREVI